MRRILGVALGVVLITTTACAGRLPDFTSTSTQDPSAFPTGDTGSSTTTTTEPPFIPEPLRGLEVQSISIIDGDEVWVLTVAVADTEAAQRRGLMDVADLQDLDGMLFAWEEPTSTTFWMKDVILPLDIVFFGEDRSLVDYFTMPLCTTDECPSYPAAGSFKYAVEVPASTFFGLTPDAMLVLDP